MLRRWFKKSSRLEHPRGDVRLQAIQALNAEQTEQQQSELEQIAQTDCDAEVRRAALQRVLNPDALVKLLDEDEFADEVASQIAQRIKAGQTTSCHDHECVLKARIAQAEAEDLDSLWPLLKTPEHCAELALRLRNGARKRVLEHPQLTTESGLTVLQRAARGKDKNVHRHARVRLDEIKAAQTQCNDARKRLDELDTAIDKSLKVQPAEAQAVISHRQKLTKLSAMRRAVVQELGSALNDQKFSIPEDPLRNVDLSLPDPNNDPFKMLVAQFEVLDVHMRAGALLSEVSAQRDTLTSAWLSHCDKFPPTPEQHQVFERVSHQFHVYESAWRRAAQVEGCDADVAAELAEVPKVDAHAGAALQERQRWRDTWRKRINALHWPLEHEPPHLVSMAEAHLVRVTQEIERLQTAFAAAEAELNKTVAQAAAAVDGGHVDAAKRFLKRARGLQKAGLKSRDREVAAVSAKVAEFDDWQHFATDPKRNECLTELQRLCDEPLEAPQQATRLKGLRQSWQQLGRPAGHAEIELQQEFDRLANIAFAPCRAYYDEQAQLRADNLARREVLCDQLQSYLTGTDWEHADMQAAEAILRSARDEWHTCHPCERKALKPVQNRFEALQDELHGKVKAAWDANLARKIEIVDQAKALLQDDVGAQVEGAKALQQAWQRVGKTPRGPDQKLWREFRQVCDQIFAQREAHHQAQQAAVQQGYEQLDAAIDALAHAATGAPTHKEFDSMSANIDHAANGLRVGGDHRKRIRQAQDAYRKALAVTTRTQTEEKLMQWRLWDEQVSRAELSHESIEAPHPVFAARVAGEPELTDCLQLVLEAEIAADLPSPSEDQGARMALQIEFMNAGRRDLGSEDYQLLIKRWCRAGPKSDVHNDLRTRFFDAVAERI